MRNRIILLLIGIGILSDVFAQGQQGINLQKKFQTFSSKFPPRNFPFVLSFDFDKMTEYETPEAIAQAESKAFIAGQGIPYRPENCSEDKFLNFVYFGKFEISKSFQTLLVGTLLDAGCGERDYLVTYDYWGTIIDTLRVFGRDYWLLPGNKDSIGGSYTIESIISKDSIYLLRAETVGPIIREKSGRKIWKRFHQRTYRITGDGKFFLIRQKDWEAYYFFKH